MRHVSSNQLIVSPEGTPELMANAAQLAFQLGIRVPKRTGPSCQWPGQAGPFPGRQFGPGTGPSGKGMAASWDRRGLALVYLCLPGAGSTGRSAAGLRLVPRQPKRGRGPGPWAVRHGVPSWAVGSSGRDACRVPLCPQCEATDSTQPRLAVDYGHWARR